MKNHVTHRPDSHLELKQWYGVLHVLPLHRHWPEEEGALARAPPAFCPGATAVAVVLRLVSGACWSVARVLDALARAPPSVFCGAMAFACMLVPTGGPEFEVSTKTADAKCIEVAATLEVSQFLIPYGLQIFNKAFWLEMFCQSNRNRMTFSIILLMSFPQVEKHWQCAHSATGNAEPQKGCAEAAMQLRL